MLNIVIPMAGRGQRFVEAGYQLPKPMIPIHGVPMIRLVIENLRPKCEHRFIFIAQADHIANHGLGALLTEWCPNSEVIPIGHITEGAACTVLLAKQHINNRDSLMIANCDQYIDADINHYLAAMADGDFDGFIMTMTADDPKWSFVEQNALGLVTRVVEKEVISSEATVGIYNFRLGEDFVGAAERMISKDLRVNGEFYVAPAYNEMIAAGRSVGIHSIGSEGAGMHGLGIPSDLDAFKALPPSEICCDKISRYGERLSVAER